MYVFLKGGGLFCERDVEMFYLMNIKCLMYGILLKVLVKRWDLDNFLKGI